MSPPLPPPSSPPLPPLSLKLHRRVDDVSDIVEVAQKELKIEQKLRVITANWAEMTLDYVPHKGTDMMVIRPSEEVSDQWLVVSD